MLRDLLAVLGLLAAIVISVGVANGWGSGGGQGTDKAGQALSKERIFATDPFMLEAGLTVVEMTHRGEGNFMVDLVSTVQEAADSEVIEFSGDKDGGSSNEIAIALADETGPVDISRAVKIPAAGEHVFNVRAEGPWSVRVEQPDPSDAVEGTSFVGEGDVATPLFSLSSGPKRVTVENANGGELQINLLDKEGNVVAPVRGTDPARSGQYPGGTSTTIDIPQDDVFLFNIRADGLWAIEVSDEG